MNRPNRKKGNSQAIALVALHVLLLVYSFSGFFSKKAAYQPFMSPKFILLYAGMLFILAVYAIGWQQIIKRLSLTLAFANKAVTVVWGMVCGALFFGESVTPTMLLGALLVIVGVTLFSFADRKGE